MKTKRTEKAASLHRLSVNSIKNDDRKKASVHLVHHRCRFLFIYVKSRLRAFDKFCAGRAAFCTYEKSPHDFFMTFGKIAHTLAIDTTAPFFVRRSIIWLVQGDSAHFGNTCYLVTTFRRQVCKKCSIRFPQSFLPLLVEPEVRPVLEAVRNVYKIMAPATHYFCNIMFEKCVLTLHGGFRIRMPRQGVLLNPHWPFALSSRTIKIKNKHGNRTRRNYINSYNCFGFSN